MTQQATATVASEQASFTSSIAPVAGENTTVAITSLDNVNNGDELKLSVTTTDLSAANAQFAVENDHTAVAGIELKLTDSTNTAVTFEGGAATITTYIVPGLDPAKVSVKYNGTGDQPTLVSYNATTGELVFTTTHFSEFYVDYEGTWYYVPAVGKGRRGAGVLHAERAPPDAVEGESLSHIVTSRQIDSN